jgi:UDP-N-acetylglucosamine 2-epimerase (non-hydrolysing)
MIDSLRYALHKAVCPRDTLRHAGVRADFVDDAKGYGVVTLHRPSNVDQPETLAPLLAVLAEVAEEVPLVFAVHPRTRHRIECFKLEQHFKSNFKLIPPQGYLEMLGLMAGAKLVLTDSGGMQEETTALAVPCLTIRENTERPITIEQGTNTLVGRDGGKIMAAVQNIVRTGGKRGRTPELWDGHAADRIAIHLSGLIGLLR